MRLPLLALVFASVFPDAIDFANAALHICGPNGLYSHSLLSIAIQMLVLGVAAGVWRRSARAGLIIAAMVLLHLAADYVTGMKVMWAGSPTVGLNMYAYPIADFILEAVLTFTAWRMLRRSPARDRWSSAPVVLALLLAAQATLDVASYLVGPVKPNGCPVSPPVRTSLRLGSGR